MPLHFEFRKLSLLTLKNKGYFLEQRLEEAMNGKIDEQHCPCDEDLEAFELGIAEDDVKKHIENCPECRSRLETIRRIDAMVVEAIKPPDDIAERVMKAVASGRKEHDWNVSPVSNRMWFRAVAVIAVLCVCTALYFVNSNSSDGHAVALENSIDGASDAIALAEPPVVMAPVVAAKEMMTRPAAKVMAKEMSVAQDMDVARSNQENNEADLLLGNREYAPRTAPAQKALRASKGEFSLAGIYANKAKGDTSINKRFIIDQGLRHVWSVDDLEAAEDFMENVAKANKKLYQIANDKNSCSVSICLKDTELQELVDKLKERGWSLLTPALPQPGKADDIAFTGKNVFYRLELVEEEK